MSNQDTSAFDAMAQQSMDVWRDIWEHAVGQAPTWQAAVAGGADAGAAQQVLEGLKGYLEWLESVGGAAGAAMPAGAPWGDALGRLFDGSANPFRASVAAMPGMHAFHPQAWQQPLDQAFGPMQQAMQSMLGLPAFGMLREHQEQQQALGRAFIDYQQQMARYQALMAEVGREAAERTQAKLAEHEEAGRQIDSLRGLYNLWVDAAEDAWAEVAMSDTYREVYGAMTNAQMRLRRLQQQQVNQAARQMGLPTRDEVDSLGERLQQARRELAQLRAGVAASARQAPASATPATPSRASAAGGKTASENPPARKAAASKAKPAKSKATKATSKKSAQDKSASNKATGRKRAATRTAADRPAANKAARSSSAAKQSK